MIQYIVLQFVLLYFIHHTHYIVLQIFHVSSGCRWRRQLPDMEGSCKYTEQPLAES